VLHIKEEDVWLLAGFKHIGAFPAAFKHIGAFPAAFSPVADY